MSIFAFPRLQNFLGEQVRVDDSNDVALLVHDRKCEKFVKDKEFARVEDGSCRRNSHHAPHHDIGEHCLQLRGE